MKRIAFLFLLFFGVAVHAQTPNGNQIIVNCPSTANCKVVGQITMTTGVAQLPASVSIAPANGSVQINGTFPLIATVLNDPSNQGVIWTVTGSNCTGAACGVISPTTSLSGAIVTYTAPPTSPIGSVVITASAVSNQSSFQSNITVVTPMPPPTGPNGNNVFTSPAQVSGTTKTFNMTGFKGPSMVANFSSVTTSSAITQVQACVSATSCVVLTQTGSIDLSGTKKVYQYRGINIGTGFNSVVVSTSDTNALNAAIFDVSSIGAFDTFATKTGTATTNPTGPSITTATANELVVCALGTTGIASNVAAPFTFDLTGGQDAGAAAVNATASAISPSWTTTSATYAALCGAYSVGTTPPAITVVNNPTSANVQASSTRTLTAVVGNDPANQGVNWTATCGSGPCGSFSPTSTASGVATTFTAPALVPAGGSVSLLQHPKLDVSANPATIPITASTAGSTLCVFDVWNTTAGTMSVTDSKGEAWGAPIDSAAQSGDSGAYDCLPNNIGGVGSITVTITGSSPTVNELYVREYSGLLPSSIVDSTPVHANTFASPMDSGSMAATTNATDLLLGFGFNGSASTFTPGTNGQGGTYANLDQQTQIGSAVMDFNTTTSTNTYKAVMTPNAASGSGIFVAALKANAGGAGNASITITATSVADPTKTAVTTVNVTAAPPPISLAVNPTSGTLTAGSGTISITPTVSNDTANLGVTWSLAGVGSITPMSSASGTPTVYTPPATVSSAASATITATSVSDTSKTASASILVNPASGPNPPPTSGCSGGVCAAFAGAGGNAEGAGAGKSVSQPNVGASGRNGTGTPQVYLITSGADSGAGTLRGCLANAGPTFCIFRVSPSSAITQHSRLSANQPYKYVAGQTAPGGPIELGGIGQAGEAIQATSHDQIFRYLTWDGNAGCQNVSVSGGTICSFAKATGPSAGTVGFEVANCSTSCYNILFDHTTMVNAGNKGWLDINNGNPSTGVTFQWGLGMEPNVAHPVVTEPDSTCQGCTVNGHGPIDFHHNLVANYDHRWILMNMGSRGLSMVNNWGVNGLQLSDSFNVGIWGGVYLDMIGNIFQDGPQSSFHQWNVIYQTNPNSGSDEADCNQAGNSSPPWCDNTQDAKLYFRNNVGHSGRNTGSAPFAPTTVANDANQVGMCQIVSKVEGGSGASGTCGAQYFVSAPTQSRLFPITVDDVTTVPAKLAPTVGNSQHLDCNGNFVSNRDVEARRVVQQALNNSNGTMFAGLTNEPEPNVPNTAVNYNGNLNANNKQNPYWPNGIPQRPTIPTAALCTMSLNDGIYDGWKQRFGLSTTDPNLWKQTDLSSGYLYIEDFLNGIVPNAIPNSATIPKSFFGQTQLNFNNTHATATTSPGVIRLWDNSACVWPLVETARGVFNWTNCDIALNSIIAAGATPDWVWGRTPGWAISGSCTGGYAPTGCAQAPSDLNTGNAILREMQTALVAHLAATHPGVHLMEEGVNESDLFQEWVGAAGTLDRIADLVTLQAAIYTSAKAADPAIIVLGPSGSGINVSNIKLWTDGNSLATKAGIFAVIDGVAIHVYEQSCSTYCASPDLMETWWPQVNTLVGVSGALYGKPVYVTEANWGGAPGPSGSASQNSAFTEAQKRQYYARQTMYAFKEGVKSFMPYAWDSHPDNLPIGFGTMCVGNPANTCVPNQAATNYATLQSWLVGATYSPNPCTVDGGGTVTCTLLTSPASTGKAAVIFNPTSTPSVTVDSSFTKVINWDGSTTPIVGHAVTAGLDPVLAVP